MRNSGRAVKFFLLVWYVYTMLMHWFYDCNLRAYMMAADFEPEVDSSWDIYEQVLKLTFTKASHISS